MDRFELWQKVDTCEQKQVAHFGRHATWMSLERRSRQEVLGILLQRRYQSLAFSPLYEVALSALIDCDTIECVRDILRAEYAGPGRPTHREDLISDLLALGATREQILRASPSKATLATVKGLFQVRAACRPAHAPTILNMLSMTSS